MGVHTVTEASDLADLIDRTLAGDNVVITRDGRPVAELRPMPTLPAGAPAAPVRTITQADLDWLEERLAERSPGEDAATLVRRMRDEDWA